MLFVPIHDKDFFEVNPGAKAIEEFAHVTARQMTFVSLVADVDYDNPLRTLPEKIRREKAAVVAGYGMEGNRPDKNARNLIDGKVPTVEKAIEKYREIQYDEDEANLAAINRQIQEVRIIMTIDKKMAATRIEINDKGETKEVVDTELMIKLANDAMKLGKGLDDLIGARDKLQARIKLKAPVIEIKTYTAGDVVQSIDDDSELSLLDQTKALNR